MQCRKDALFGVELQCTNCKIKTVAIMTSHVSRRITRKGKKWGGTWNKRGRGIGRQEMENRTVQEV